MGYSKKPILPEKERTFTEILDWVCRTGMVSDLIQGITQSRTELKEDLKDLEQDIYETLCKAKPEFIERLYAKGQLRFFICRLLMNNICSKTSRYYYIYKKRRKQQRALNEDADI